MERNKLFRQDPMARLIPGESRNREPSDGPQGLFTKQKTSVTRAIMIALAAVATTVIILIVGCSGAATTTAPQPAGPSLPPTPLPTVPLAPVKSVMQAKPVDPSSASGPRLAIDSQVVDFGDVPYQVGVAFSFNIKNVGKEPITLVPPFIRVKEGC